MFHALADIWRVFIFSTAEYQTTIAAVIFSTNRVRQILKNHLHYAVFMRHNMCYFVALVLCHWPILASGFFQVVSTVIYTAVFWAVDRVVDADEQYSVSFFRNHLFHFIISRHIFQPQGRVLAYCYFSTADGYLCGCYFTAIFMLSLPILATTTEPDCAAKDVVPLMAVAEPRALPSMP